MRGYKIGPACLDPEKLDIREIYYENTKKPAASGYSLDPNYLIFSRVNLDSVSPKYPDYGGWPWKLISRTKNLRVLDKN